MKHSICLELVKILDPLLAVVKVDVDDDKVANKVKVWEKEEEDIESAISPFSEFLPKFIQTQLFSTFLAEYKKPSLPNKIRMKLLSQDLELLRIEGIFEY